MIVLQPVTAIGLAIVFISLAIFLKATRGWPAQRPDRDLLREAQVYAGIATLCLLGSSAASVFIAEASRTFSVVALLAGSAGCGVIISIARMTEKRRLRDLAHVQARASAKGGDR